jgi:hypothetical protein
MVYFGADNKKLCFSLLKLSLNLESLHTTKAVAIIQTTCFSKMCWLFGCSQQALDEEKKLFTIDNFSKGLFSLFGVKAKTCFVVCLMKSIL